MPHHSGSRLICLFAGALESHVSGSLVEVWGASFLRRPVLATCWPSFPRPPVTFAGLCNSVLVDGKPITIFGVLYRPMLAHPCDGTAVPVVVRVEDRARWLRCSPADARRGDCCGRRGTVWSCGPCDATRTSTKCCMAPAMPARASCRRGPASRRQGEVRSARKPSQTPGRRDAAPAAVNLRTVVETGIQHPVHITTGRYNFFGQRIASS